MKVCKRIESEFDLETCVDKLLYAELRSAESRAFWREMTWGELAQELLPHELQYLEDRYA